MNTILVGFMTLMPALVALIVVIGVPAVLGALLLPDLLAHLRRKQTDVNRVLKVGHRRRADSLRQGSIGLGRSRKAIPA